MRLMLWADPSTRKNSLTKGNLVTSPKKKIIWSLHKLAHANDTTEDTKIAHTTDDGTREVEPKVNTLGTEP
jgi:hypothetical protein